MKRFSIFLAFMLLFPLGLRAQQGDDFINDLISKTNSYFRQNARVVTYLHTDRDTYFPGERILVSAYITDASSGLLSDKCERLALSITDSKGNSVLVHELPLKDGRGAADILLPGNTGASAFYLVSWPLDQSRFSGSLPFVKKIRLEEPTGLIALSAQSDRESYRPGEMMNIRTRLSRNNGQPLKGSNLKYWWSDEGKEQHIGETRTGKTGEAELSVDLPADFQSSSLILNLESEFRKAKKDLVLRIPVKSAADKISFFPEGGTLVAGQKVRVAFEARDRNGWPVQVEGRVTDDKGTELARLSCDESGLGSFVFVPEMNARYLFTDAGGRSFPLPAVSANGLAVAVGGVSDDKLMISTSYAGLSPDSRLYIVLHHKGLVYWASSGEVQQIASFGIPVRRVPEGVCGLTFFDEQGKVLAERLVYLGSDNQPALQAELSNPVPGKRKRLDVTVKLINTGPGQPELVLLSAAVSPSVLLSPAAPDIMESFLLHSGLDRLSYPCGNGSASPAERDLLMLTSQRSGYTWSELGIGAAPAAVPKGNADAGMDAQVYFREQLLPVYANSPLTASDQSLYLHFARQMVDKRMASYGQEHYQEMLASGTPVLDVIKSMKSYTMKGNLIIFPGGQNSILYQSGALIVIDEQMMGQDASVLSSLSPYEVETIRISTEPTDIQKYTGLNTIGVIEVTLKGSSMKGRLKAEDPRAAMVRYADGYLPGYPDYTYSSDADNVVSDHRATLFWDPALVLNESGEVTFSFYTSDEEGEYTGRIVGVYKGIPLSASFTFNVR
ncbi:MAG: hypothetical protein ACOYXB_10055 [Bacteroidota bacterium]